MYRVIRRNDCLRCLIRGEERGKIQNDNQKSRAAFPLQQLSRGAALVAIATAALGRTSFQLPTCQGGGSESHNLLPSRASSWPLWRVQSGRREGGDPGRGQPAPNQQGWQRQRRRAQGGGPTLLPGGEG